MRVEFVATSGLQGLQAVAGIKEESPAGEGAAGEPLDHVPSRRLEVSFNLYVLAAGLRSACTHKTAASASTSPQSIQVRTPVQVGAVAHEGACLILLADSPRKTARILSGIFALQPAEQFDWRLSH